MGKYIDESIKFNEEFADLIKKNKALIDATELEDLERWTKVAKEDRKNHAMSLNDIERERLDKDGLLPADKQLEKDYLEKAIASADERIKGFEDKISKYNEEVEKTEQLILKYRIDREEKIKDLEVLKALRESDLFKLTRKITEKAERVNEITDLMNKLDENSDEYKKLDEENKELSKEINELGNMGTGKKDKLLRELEDISSGLNRLVYEKNKETEEARKEIEIKADPIKVDIVKADPIKVDTVKVDTVKVDTVKVDTVKVDPIKADTVKPDPVKSAPRTPAPGTLGQKKLVIDIAKGKATLSKNGKDNVVDIYDIEANPSKYIHDLLIVKGWGLDKYESKAIKHADPVILEACGDEREIVKQYLYALLGKEEMPLEVVYKIDKDKINLRNRDEKNLLKMAKYHNKKGIVKIDPEDYEFKKTLGERISSLFNRNKPKAIEAAEPEKTNKSFKENYKLTKEEKAIYATQKDITENLAKASEADRIEYMKENEAAAEAYNAMSEEDRDKAFADEGR